jgi:hypothetical protein
MIANQLVNRQKKVTSLFEIFGTKGNGKTDYANLLREEWELKGEVFRLECWW